MESVQPARLNFLTIYNPSFGQSDETVHDQILYYYSHSSRRKVYSKSFQEPDREEENERLRQIGLAQGMVEFAKYGVDELHDFVKANS